MLTKFFRRLNIQRFTALDLIVYLANAGYHSAEYGAGQITVSEIVIRTLILIIVWMTISISLQLYLGTKLFNGFSFSEDIDSPRY